MSLLLDLDFRIQEGLIRKLGFFDERFIGGGYEDVDFARRNNLGPFQNTKFIGFEKSSYFHITEILKSLK